MAKRVKDATLDSKAARSKKEARDKPYYRSIARGLHLGYRRHKAGGRWVVRYWHDGAYKVETFGEADDLLDADGKTVFDFDEAQDEARRIHAERTREPVDMDEDIGPYTVRRATGDYLESLEAEGKPTLDAKYRIDAHILPELGDIECAKLSRRRLQRWHTKLAKSPARLRSAKGQAPKFRALDTDDEDQIRQRRASAKRTLAILKAALNHAWQDGKVSSDGEWRRVKAYKGVDKARTAYLKIDEVLRLINACDEDFREIVHAAVTTGARYGELTRMACRDYDPENRTVLIKLSKTGKGRHVYLDDEGGALFDRLTAGRPPEALIFRRSDGAAWGPAHQQRRMREACKRARIDPPVGFHQLRHTYASHTVMNGCELIVLATNMGHRDTRMVELHYGHLAREFMAERIRATAPKFGISQPSNVERLGA